jgi:predicted metalloprotease
MVSSRRWGTTATAAARAVAAVAATVILASCSTSPTAVPEAEGFALPETQPSSLHETCPDTDRVEASRCLVEEYLPLLDSIFEPVVASRGEEFQAPTVITDDAGGATACGDLTSPAYCPSDQTLVIPLAKVTNLGDRAPDAALERVLFNPAVREYFTRELTNEELTTGGAYSAVIVTVHEYAHHVQNLIGSIAIYQNQERNDQAAVSRRIELEADCLTGWVSGYLNKSGTHVPTVLDNWAAATTLTEIGDDFIDPSVGAGNHGTIEQRVAAWQEGIIAGITLTEPYAACMAITDQVLAGTTGMQGGG